MDPKHNDASSAAGGGAAAIPGGESDESEGNTPAITPKPSVDYYDYGVDDEAATSNVTAATNGSVA
eukprot:scaffold3499_cov85-Skeletonema_menzelii.AAC.2